MSRIEDIAIGQINGFTYTISNPDFGSAQFKWKIIYSTRPVVCTVLGYADSLEKAVEEIKQAHEKTYLRITAVADLVYRQMITKSEVVQSPVLGE